LAMAQDKAPISGNSIAAYAKHCFNKEFVDLLLSLLIHLHRLRFSLERDRENREKQFVVDFASPMPELEFPREFPKNMGHRRPCLAMIEHGIDNAIETGIRIGKESGSSAKYVLLRGQLLVNKQQARSAVSLILSDAAAKCSFFSGSYPAPTNINPVPSPVTCLDSHLNEALPTSHLQLIGIALKEMGALTQAAIAFYYANEKNEAFSLVNVSDRWDSLETWYSCISSVSLLEFICAAHHRQGQTEKRDLVKKLIGQPNLNQHNSRKLKLEIKTKKKLKFLRKLWRLHVE
jgi:hypothetical protein